MAKALVTLEAILLAQTAKAIKIDIDDVTSWVPRVFVNEAQSDDLFYDREQHSGEAVVGNVVLPEWLAEEKGWL